MDVETSLFVSDSDTPTVPLGSARCLADLGTEGVIICYSSSSGEISMSVSKDRGSSWAAPISLVTDGSCQFTVATGKGKVYLLYVTSGKSLKVLTITPNNTLRREDERVVYMYHEETGEPAFPAAYCDAGGTLHLVSTFRRASGWSVLYCQTSESEWQPWEEIASGQGLSACYSSISGAGDSIHIIHRLNVDGRYQLFHRERTLAQWSESYQLTFSDGHNGTPAMETDGSSLYCSWVRTGTRGDSLIFRKFDCSGWSPELRLSSDDGCEYGPPSISQFGGGVTLCWNKGPDLLFRASFDNGRSWTEEKTVDTCGKAIYPKAGALQLKDDGSLELVVAWTKSGFEIYGGTAGVETCRLTMDPDGELVPTVYGKVSQNPPRMKIIDITQDDTIRGSKPKEVNIGIEDTHTPANDGFLERFAEYDQKISDIQSRSVLSEERMSIRLEKISAELERVSKELQTLKNRLTVIEGRISKPVQILPQQSGKPSVSIRSGGAEVGSIRFKENKPAKQTSGEKHASSNEENTGILRRIFGFGKKGGR